MNAISHPKLDDILTFLPGISEDEYQSRAKLRSLRNTASRMIATTVSGTARQLAWLASDYASTFVYARADQQTLKEIGRFCTRLMLCAIQAEELDDEGLSNEPC